MAYVLYEDSQALVNLSACSAPQLIAFAKPVHPQQLLQAVNRDHKIDEDSQARVNLLM